MASGSSRHFKRCLGIDLGGGRGKTTALAVLRADDDCAWVTDVQPRPGSPPLYDGNLVELIRRDPGDLLLCIDAPLTLPACLRCRVPVCPGQEACVDPAVLEMRRAAALAFGGDERDRDRRKRKPTVTPYTQRATEIVLQTRGIAPRETLGQGTGPLTARASHLLRALADLFRLNQNLLEVYPKATLLALGFRRPYKKHLHERETRAAVLESLSGDLRFAPGVWRERCVQSDHLFEAVISAYTGYLWARENWTLPHLTAPVHEVDGWIWVPPVPGAVDDRAPAPTETAAEG